MQSFGRWLGARQPRPKVRVKVRMSHIPRPMPGGGVELDDYLSVTIENHAAFSVPIAAVELLRADGDRVVLPRDPVTGEQGVSEVGPSRTMTRFFGADAVAAALPHPIAVSVRDELGREWREPVPEAHLRRLLAP